MEVRLPFRSPTSKIKQVYVVVLACALLSAPLNGAARVATIEGATLNYIHADHLTGSNAVTNSTAGMVQLLDYYPYGGLRIDWKYAMFDEQRKFAGHEYDRDTGLSYMQSRYYNGGIGRFISQDPAFLAVGDDAKLKQITKLSREKYLSDPQLANSYSYVANNPLKYNDSEGEFIDTLADLAFIGYDVYKIGQAWYQGESVKGELANLGLDVGGALIPGVTGLGMANRVVKVGNKGFNPITQQRGWLEGVKNPKVENLIKGIFRDKDKMSGGTIEALRKELTTSELTGGKSHVIKGQQTINRIENIFKSEKLNHTEANKLNAIKDAIKSLFNSAKK